MIEWMLLGAMLSTGQAAPEKPQPDTKPTTVKPVQDWPPANVVLPEENCNCNGEEEKEEEDEGPTRLFPDEILGFKITGWAYGTANYNATNSGNTRYNGPMTTNDQEGVYLNQLWVNINRSLKDDELSWGANLDVFFGNDYLSSLSRGFENDNARGLLSKR